MRCLAALDGPRGEIVVLEELDTGARCYFEGGVFQSHATRHGISLFAYVHLIARIVRKAENVLVVGCAAGSLATMLHHAGKRVTLIDNNPLSFDIAHEFFGLPKKVERIVADFREFMLDRQGRFDGVGIDIGAPGMQFEQEFDFDTCRLLRTCLAPGGRIAANIVVNRESGLMPDRILANLVAQDRIGWIYDQPWEVDRNAVIVALPARQRCLGSPLDSGGFPVEQFEWQLRRQRFDNDILPELE